MSINSRMSIAELQEYAEIQEQPSGEFINDWVKEKDISISIFNKDDRIYRSNSIEIAESTHIGITFIKGLKKGRNRIIKDNDIYEITSTNDDAPKSIIYLKKVVPSGEL